MKATLLSVGTTGPHPYNAKEPDPDGPPDPDNLWRWSVTGEGIRQLGWASTDEAAWAAACRKLAEVKGP